MRATLNVSVAIAAMVMILVAMGVGWHVDNVDLSEKLAAERAVTAILEERLSGQETEQQAATGRCDGLLATACEGLWACNWQEQLKGVIFDAREIDDWTESMRKQDEGLRACRKSYPKGAEYGGGER